MKEGAVARPLPIRRPIAARMATALPSVAEALFGGVVWGTAMSASAYVGLGRVNGRIDGHLPGILVLFFIGGALALPLAAFAIRLVAMRKHVAVRLAAALTLLPIATIGMTALLFALDNARFYVGWTDLISGPFGLFEILITVAVSLAAFVVLGVRLFFPFGLLALIVGSAWLVRRVR